jgi:hypothetical protein
MRIILIVLLVFLTAACTTPLTLAPHGQWDGATELGPVMACKGGSASFDRECSDWPLSISSLPSPDTHYTELKAKAATQYNVDPSLIVLKDVSVKYVIEINGVIRGWKATTIAGRHSLN